MASTHPLWTSGRAFILAAFDLLHSQHVLPAPTFRRALRVGRDYAGPDLMALEEFKALESAMESAYGWRFDEPLKRPENAQFAHSYMFSFLEAAITLCAGVEDYSSRSPGIEAALAQLVNVLDTRESETVCCRVVSHLVTTDSAPIESGNLTVVPEPAGFRSLEQLILNEIPTAGGQFDGIPLTWDPPHAVIIARDSTVDVDPVRVGMGLSAQIDDFLLQVRLLSSGTVRSLYEIRGAATLICAGRPQLVVISDELMPTMVSRVVEISDAHVKSAAALGALLARAPVPRDDLVFSSFDLALHKFSESYRNRDGLETLVDLAVALEASLADADGSGESVTLRLCTRAAALLATADDSGSAIFADIYALYGLRSRLIHGGTLKQKRLYDVIKAISTVPDGDPPGIAIARAVDRMRDLVRRAIIARAALAAGEQPLWPFKAPSSFKLDTELADDGARASWRNNWREHLSGIGAANAADLPGAPADFFTQGQARRTARSAAQSAAAELEQAE
jgi:hypothetical protein